MKKVLETLLNDVSKSPVIDDGDLKAASHLILQSVMTGLGVDRCGIWLYQEDLAGITCFFLIDAFTQSTEESLVLNRSDLPMYFAALEEDRNIVAHDARIAPETSEFKDSYLDVLGITSMLDTPIRHSGKTVGIICTEHRGEPRHWQDDEIVFSGILSDLFGRAISAREKLDVEQQLIQANQNLEVLVTKRTKHLEHTIEQMKQLQQQLIESEKMASLANIVSGVAHEVNTPLGIALTATSHIKDEVAKLAKCFDDNAITREKFKKFIQDSTSALTLSEDNLYRAATLVKNFKRTSADQNHFEEEEIDLHEYVTQVLSTLVPLTKKISADVHLDDCKIIKKTLPGALAQIITNLVANSCTHAFRKDTSHPSIYINMKKQDEDKVVLTYRDNGQGMAEDEVKKAFDPFYTTNRSEGGTGLGLSIVHTLATQNLGGSINIKSGLDAGTEFKITF